MTTLDKSVPYYPVLMVLHKEHQKQTLKLAEGYRFVAYEEKYKEPWIALHAALGQIASIEDGRAYFKETFEAYPDQLKNQMILLVDNEDHLAGTSSLWYGNHFGKARLRVHWVGVDPKHQRKGLAKALMIKTIEDYDTKGLEEALYLTTQTNSYIAIGMYYALGFYPYKGEKPVNFHAKEETFMEDNQKAWDIINQKLEVM